ncbi:hypothetical protein JOB18_008790 [Solea senegalensis]|uniref:Uncharacterized protein n=1 Tax=Solea senegalensis TaxID=28829 RepID=A0AAV6SQW8_SOLSE|nr:hypothetical protein JOB18_008790 [Solea senegalensis]
MSRSHTRLHPHAGRRRSNEAEGMTCKWCRSSGWKPQFILSRGQNPTSVLE